MVLNDFLHCEKTGDWNTIKNRMTNGIKWGWLKEVVQQIEHGLVDVDH